MAGKKPVERRYRISEVSETVGVPAYLLRQWEERIPQLRPRRDRVNRRYYLEKDIEIIKRIKTLVWHERLTFEGARVRLAQEIFGEGRPRNRTEIRAMVDGIEADVRAMLRDLDETLRS